MAVIDEKGRIFGKFNIIDLLAIVLILAAAVVLVGKVMDNRNATEHAQMNLRYTVQVKNVDANVCRAVRAISLPDQLMASGELVSGYVTAVREVAAQEPVFQFTENDEGVLEVTKGINEGFDLLFTVEAYISDRVSNELGTQEIRIGKEHILKTCNFEFESGTIVSCEWLDTGA